MDRPPERQALSPKAGSPDGEVALLRFEGDRSEAKGVAALTEQLIERDGLEASDVLILLKGDHNGTFSKPIREELEKLSIECTDPGYVEGLLAEPDNRRVLAMLRLLVQPRDSLAWGTLLKLGHGIGAKFFEYVYKRALPSQQTFAEALVEAHGASFPDAPKPSAGKASELVGNVLPWLDATPLPEKLPDGGWSSWLDDLVSAGTLLAPAAAFRELFAEVEEQLTDDERLSLGQLLSQLQPIGKDLALARSDGVRIMTMVGSKGLTVEAAILVGLEEGVVPRADSDLNEERRILYVAMTRAKRFLFGTWAQRRKGPTQRAGAGSNTARSHSTFLDGGPVSSQDGDVYLNTR